MRFDLIVRGGRVVAEGREAALDIGVSEGRIAAIEPDLPGDAGEVVDASGLVVLPGVVDTHVHFNEPGRTEWEGIASGSAALAAGGGTVFQDMPLNSTPATVDGASFDLKLAAANGKAAADFGLWGGLVPGDLDRMDELADRGVVGFKAFMSNSGIEDFLHVDDDSLQRGMERARALGLPVAVHAESETLAAQLALRARQAGLTGVRDYLESRSIELELEAIRTAVRLGEETGCSLHIVHVSSGAGVALIAEARSRGVDVTCETCPHYLVFEDADVERIGAAAKCAPPIRPRGIVEDLWERVLGGDVDFIASDHSPAPLALKTTPDFFEVWGGIAGCQSMLPVMLTEGHLTRNLSLSRIADLLATVPAERFRLPQKGRLTIGYDADFTLVDLKAATELREDDLLYRHRISPYIGMAIHGLVRHTFLRGLATVTDGLPTGAVHGRLLRPEKQ